MQVKILKFQYKGGRDYIHGTDIFNQTVSWLKSEKDEVTDIDLALHRLAMRHLQVIPGAAPEGVQAVAVCSYTTAGVRERISLVEIEEVVTGRYDYPEDEIVQQMRVDTEKRQGVLAGPVEYSDIEVLVAMTKALHYKVFSDLKGKWLFVRGRFPRPLPNVDAKERTLTITASFNDKLTRSEAVLDGVKVGEIYFSIV